ncbi:DUF748 domain-containing protein [Halopseudomonas salina]|uniref:DUF748 domain-containing protein n=1 Tax=Halopseudomonas salina TaxID=1323744 RepID=A0ABQ1Q481_9GAMM|nr:DUF748 domain-containing protein [Halopseudomonas salina]GGD11721.1 hypothetical protein GCM10007418_33380 [Halopseudomonas salina]
MSKRNKSLTVGLLSAVFIYCLLGFLVLPGIALHVVNSQLEQRVSVPTRLDSLEFNPFSLELSLGELEIGQPGNPVLSFQRLYANLEITSLWRGALELESLTIERAWVAATLQESGELNLSRLLNRPEGAQQLADEEAATPFPVRIAHLKLVESRLYFQDLQPTNAVQARLERINMEIRQFSTLPGERSELLVSAEGPSNSQLQVQGSMGMLPLSSAGTLSIDGLPLSPFWPYVRDQIDLALQDGVLSTRFDYQMDLAQDLSVNLDKASATLSAFDITSPQGDSLARLSHLHIDDASLDLAARSIRVGTVRSRQLEAWISRAENGKVNWQAILPAAQDNSQPEQQAAWQIRLPDVQLREYRVNLTDRQPDSPLDLTLSSLELDLTGFDSATSAPFGLSVKTQINEEGFLSAKGQASLEPISLDLQVAAQNLALAQAQTYLDPFVRIDIRDGKLNTTAHVQLEALDPLALHVDAKADITDLHIVDSLENRDLVRWESLSLDGIVYRDNSLSVEQAQLLKPYARIIINQDLSTNIGNLVIEQPVDDNQTDQAPMAIRIGAVGIEKGSLNFADFSLQPNVALTVEELTGRIGTLDNQNTDPAELNLSGQVDRYAPVQVQGTLTPFDPLNSLDVQASFKDIELTTLSPYARKFAGYRIRKGRLDLDLHYQINAGNLEADNQVLLRDLQLGERVDSPNAVDLPIRLAVALLKDGKGNINITLPVQGDLSNPDFDIMPVIWQSLGNLLSRAATAPFRFIANLFGGDDADLSHVLFAPGAAALDAQARKQLDTLASALNDRPALRLEVEGMSSPAEDGLLVAQQRLDRELNRRWKKAVDQGQAEPSATQSGVPQEAIAGLLGGIYQERTKKEVPAEWSELDAQARNERMRNAILETWQGSEALLRRLAQERNESIKAYLVDNAGLSAQRVQLLDVGVEAVADNGEVPTTLHLSAE